MDCRLLKVIRWCFPIPPSYIAEVFFSPLLETIHFEWILGYTMLHSLIGMGAHGHCMAVAMAVAGEAVETVPQNLGLRSRLVISPQPGAKDM